MRAIAITRLTMSSFTIGREPLQSMSVMVINRLRSKIHLALKNVSVRPLHIDFDVDKQEVTVGWIYDIANNSERESYIADVTFHLADRDQFKVVTMNESTFIRNQSFETIRGTTTMGINDFKRINNDTWSISLTPNWSSDPSTSKTA